MSDGSDPNVGRFTSEDSYSAWRGKWLRDYTEGLKVEAAARATGLPFEPRQGWGRPSADWCEWRIDLATFASMVRRAAAVLGPPDKVDSEGSIDPTTPDLRATWTRDGVVFSVRALTPVGCKVDPRTPDPVTWAEQERRAAKLHPECKAVLAELEEL